MGVLTSLEQLVIAQCPSLNKLLTSLGQVSRLCGLTIDGCGELQPQILEIMDYGNLEALGLSRILQRLRIWGCTSISELPGSCVMVLANGFSNPDYFWDTEEKYEWVRYDLKEMRVVEANDYGVLRHVQDIHTIWGILHRVYNSPCCILTSLIHLNVSVAIEWQVGSIISQLNALKKLKVTECTNEAISILEGWDTFRT